MFSLEEFYGHYIFSGILANFSDMQTVLFACISTLLPLIIALGIAFGIRYANFAYCERDPKYLTELLFNCARSAV